MVSMAANFSRHYHITHSSTAHSKTESLTTGLVILWPPIMGIASRLCDLHHRYWWKLQNYHTLFCNLFSFGYEF